MRRWRRGSEAMRSFIVCFASWWAARRKTTGRGGKPRPDSGGEPFPQPADLRAQYFGVLPRIGEGRERVAAFDRPKFGADEDLAIIGCVPRKPAFEKSLCKRQPVAEFLRKRTAAVGNGNLHMMAVEGAEVKLLRVLDQLRPTQEA